MERVVHRTCTICDASCGIEVRVEGERVVSIRGDERDPLSRGYVCPKVVALRELHEDPSRLRRPLLRTQGGWREIPWDEALERAAAGLCAARDAHGGDAVALYSGEPLFHNLGGLLFLDLLAAALGGKRFSCSTLDEMPRRLSLHWMLGNANFMPVPDIDRTRHLLLIGANTAIAHGGMMTTPDAASRLSEIRARGGRVVVIDPRRSETAELADEHHFIRPGSDALLLAAMLQTLFSDGRVRKESFPDFVEGLAAVEAGVAPFRPEEVAGSTGIDAGTIRRLAREFADAECAVAYGHIGTKLVPFGTTASWLTDVLNVVTGNLDRPGGLMFPSPGVDAARLQGTSDPGPARSRISGTPEFLGQLPAATLAGEMTTPGEGRVRALVTVAGNPVLSSPAGRQLSEALDTLDFMVSVDLYRNETTRHAHLILPPVTPLERDHYELAYHQMAVRSVAHWSPAALAREKGARTDAEIMVALAQRLMRGSGWSGRAASLGLCALLGLGPERVARLAVAAAIRFGPHGSGLRLWRRGLTLGAVRRSLHGVDLGPPEPALPQRLPARPDGRPRVELAPPALLADLGRLRASLEKEVPELVLIGRRELRSINSWAHNLPRLVSGRERCVLQVHPQDAARRGLASGDRARLATRSGKVEVPVEVTDCVMPGVVSLPHGWGHDREGSDLPVARERAGASFNDLTDPARLDPLSGTAALNGIPVLLEPSRPA